MNDGHNETCTGERKLIWDEENRLLAVDDNGFVSNYWYDADGERTVKTSGESDQVYVNGVFSGGSTNTAKFSLYVSPYLVANQGGRYTKHIYAGSQRIVSKIGDFASYGSDPRRIEYAGANTDGLSVDYKAKYAAQQQVIKDNYKTFDVPYNGTDNDNYADGEGFCCNDGSMEAAMAQARKAQARAVARSFKAPDNYENLQFFYHPDHLGSSNFITNLEGEVVQHIEYVPFGEVFIEERNNVWNTPYLFNAKEFDEETGLYYYGARYYDSKLSIWMSVDPLVEKTLQPYQYAYNNPIRYIDFIGLEGEEPDGIVGYVIKWFKGDPTYKGSGWGHGPRTQLKNLLGLDSNISNVAEAGVMSMLQADEVNVTGQALEKIKNDPAVKEFDQTIIQMAKNNPKFGKSDFEFTYNQGIQLGGKRAPDDMREQAKRFWDPKYRDTWKVAANELTWLVRSVYVKSEVSVSVSGLTTIKHSFSDIFDLRPSGGGRNEAYDATTKVLGFFYHDVCGGNDQMRVNATWKQVYQIKKK